MSTDAAVPAILVVDDNRSNLLALEAVLEPLGFQIVAASSGAEALKRLIEHDYVLVIMDVHMPELDGYQTVALMRQRERSKDIPIIFLTAVYNQPEHTHRGYALGAVDYLTKPFDPEVLRGKVGALVRLYTRGARAERERSELAESMKDLFLGAIGHDLRNPLNAIVLGAQLIARDVGPDRPAHTRHAQRIERAAKRMQGIIDDILDLTRGQFTGGIPVARERTSLLDVCRLVIEECRIAHPKREVRLDVSGELVGRWDPARLGRIVSNLVGNAIEHVQDGVVVVRAVDDGDGVELSVHNSGAPIPSTVMPKLFEPFRRGDTSINGLGLGLYIVREIARAHGGTVDVTSNESEGTKFRVRLPKNG